MEVLAMGRTLPPVAFRDKSNLGGTLESMRLFHHLLNRVLFGSVLLTSICSIAQPATPLADPGDAPDAVAKLIFTAVTEKNWALLAAVLLSVGVWGARKLPVPFFKTKLGGILLTLVGASTGALSTALVAGQPLTVGLAVKTISIGVMAAGGWSVFKNFLEHFEEKKAQAAGVAAAADLERR